MPNTSVTPHNPSRGDKENNGDEVSVTQVPEIPQVPVRDVGGTLPARPRNTSYLAKLSPEERKAVEEAARNLSVDDVLAQDGIDRIHRKVAGHDVLRSAPIKPGATLKDLAGDLHADLKTIVSRLIRKAVTKGGERP